MKDSKVIIKTLVVFFLVTIIYFGGIVITNLFFCKPENLGSSAGAITGYFSALAFVGIYTTIYLQRKGLELQKEESKQQDITLYQQRFENTFFQIVTLHHNIVSQIEYIEKYKKISYQFDPRKFIDENRKQISEDAERILKGRDVFKLYYDKMYQLLEGIHDIQDVNEIYINSYENFQNSFGHYLRNLYRILKFVDESTLSYKDKYSYTSIIRAQISDYELLLLYYNCLSENGFEKFKPLIERYTFFKNLPQDRLGSIEHISFYDISAFEKKQH